MSTALYLGRFQPFHLGHLKVIQEILKENDKIIIGIGSLQEKNTKENPFSASERIEMINLALQEAGISMDKLSFIEIPDTFNDLAGIEKVLGRAKFNIAYTNNNWTKLCFQEKGIKAKGTKYFSPYKGELIRKRIAKGKPWGDFVPKAVFGYLIRIGGDSRIKGLSKANNS